MLAVRSKCHWAATRGLAQSQEPCSNGPMKSLARISAIGIVGLGIGAATPAFGDAGTAVPTVAQSNVGPIQKSTPAAPARANTQPHSTSVIAPERLETTAVGSTSGAEENKSVGGGYSWSEKKRRLAKKSVRTEPLDPNRPLAQAPNFELRPDGSSIVTLSLSHPTEVTRTTAGRRVEYQLKRTQIGVANNTNPLVTAHFATPLRRVVLRRNKNFATLSLELREDVLPIHQLRTGPGGGQLLEIMIPKPTRNYLAPQGKSPSMREDRRAKADSSPRPERHKAARPAPKSAPGPKL